MLQLEQYNIDRIEEAQQDSADRVVAIHQQANSQIEQAVENLGDVFGREFNENISTAEGLRAKPVEVKGQVDALVGQEYNAVINCATTGGPGAPSASPAIDRVRQAASHIRR